LLAGPSSWADLAGITGGVVGQRDRRAQTGVGLTGYMEACPLGLAHDLLGGVRSAESGFTDERPETQVESGLGEHRAVCVLLTGADLFVCEADAVFTGVVQ
jgi:hypothetical protein